MCAAHLVLWPDRAKCFVVNKLQQIPLIPKAARCIHARRRRCQHNVFVGGTEVVTSSASVKSDCKIVLHILDVFCQACASALMNMRALWDRHPLTPTHLQMRRQEARAGIGRDAVSDTTERVRPMTSETTSDTELGLMPSPFCCHT